jgi:small GTP-binding protein
MSKLVKMKISIIGDFATGKTSLIRRFVDNAFARDYRPTIGSNIFIKKIELFHNNVQYYISCNIFEVAGQDRWQKARKTYYSGTQGLIFIGDLSRKRTFQQIKDFWWQDAKPHISEKVPILIVANKCDLQEDIEDKEIRDIMNQIRAFSYIKTSAKENIHINQVFLQLVTRILDETFMVEGKNEENLN